MQKTYIRASSGLAVVAKVGESTLLQLIPAKRVLGPYSQAVFGHAPRWHFPLAGDHNLMTGTRDDGGMRKVSQEDLDALNSLVQDGLIEVVSIDEFGEPSYRLASEFTAEQIARTGGSPRVWDSAPVPKPDVRSVCRRSRCPVANIETQPVPSKAPKASEGIP